MRKVLFIFGQLTDMDIEWLAKAGRRKRLAANTVLINEGGRVETLFILLEGELVVQSAKGREIARLGVGEIVGEMSFIEARPPSATVRAATDVVVYAIPRQVLERGLADNIAFAARFYKAVATFLSDRVRSATAREQGIDRDAVDELDDAVLDNVDRAGARFDALGRLLLDG
ncbi:MAG TPA: cyclic nucleotide-binding domain-containing protein [Polyangiaceae bacterium]|jgi:CRP-like cAMP-binding protein|nr:cyclic nucleotide-binding domain-containing protein [Polyangiaceae bacterium]